jgi:hypothetical protein
MPTVIDRHGVQQLDDLVANRPPSNRSHELPW